MSAAPRAVVIGMLIAGMVPFTPLFLTVQGTLDWNTDQAILGTQTISNEVILLSGNLNISGSLTLSNTELVVFGTKNGSFSINVEDGGTFNILAGSRIHAANSAYRYAFRAAMRASLKVDRSSVEDCGWYGGTQDQKGLYIQTSSASITNSTLKNNCNGVIVAGASSPWISGNIISTNDQSGVYVLAGSSPTISTNLISGNLRDLGNSAGATNAGVYATSADAVITRNVINRNVDLRYGSYGSGVLLTNSGTVAHPVVEYNDITGHNDSDGWGIRVSNNDATIYKNNITDNANGILIQQGACTVEGNLIEDNLVQGTPPTGEGIEDAGHSTYSRNTLRHNAVGVYLADYSLSQISDCDILGNVVAGVSGDATTNAFSTTFTNCTFTNNGNDVVFDSAVSPSKGGIAFFENTTHDPQKIIITDSDAKVKVSWNMRVGAIFENGSRVADLAKVKVFDKKGNEMFTFLTDKYGQTNWMVLEQKTQNWFDNVTRTPYNVTGEKSDLRNWTLVDLTSSREVLVILDDTWPWVGIDSPANGDTINRTSVNISCTASPGAKLLVNGIAANATGGAQVALVNLTKEGPNDIRVRGNDGGRNEAFANITLIRDITAPTISLATPVDRVLVNHTPITVAGNVSEITGQTTINGAEISINPDGSFSVDVDLIEDENSILIECRDAVWNGVSVLRTVFLDSIGPLLVVTEPGQNFTTNATVVTIKGYTDINSTMTLNGQFLHLNDTDWTATVGLVEGENLFDFTAHDSAGNTNTRVVRVFRDTTPPSLIVVSPKDGSVFNTSNVKIRGIVEEGSTVKVNGIPVLVTGGEFSADVKLDRQGRNTVKVEAWDPLYNRAEESLIINLDTTRPELKVTGPINNYLTNGKSFILLGRTERGANLTVNDRPVLVDAVGAFSVSMNLNSEGPNIYEVRAQDPAGNVASHVLTVIKDSEITYNITQPQNGAKVKTSTVLVIGGAEANATVKVNGKVVGLRPDHTFISEQLLTEGKNHITIDIRDRAGNNVTLDLLVIRESSKPPAKGFIPGLTLAAVVAAAAIAMGAVGWLRRKTY